MAVALFAMAACSGEPDRSPSPGVRTSAAPLSSIPYSTEPGLDCTAPIGSLAEPPGGYTVLLGAVALSVGEELQVENVGDGRYFAKTGLMIRTGQAAELVVAVRSAEVEWGNTGAGPRTAHLRIPPCPKSGAGEWQVYPGGYYVTAPVCLPVEIRADGRTARIRVPVGAPCPAGTG